MKRGARPWLLLLASLGGLACDGRDVAVFDVQAEAGSGGSVAGSNSSGAANGGSGSEAGSSATSAGAGGSGSEAGSGPLGGAGSAAQGGGMGGGGMPGVGGTPATPCCADVDCSPGWLCEKQSCDAPLGFCEPRPLFPKPEPLPVCGCDGVTYWNDDIRRQAGAQVASQGECRVTACACEVGSDCKVPNASCSHLVAPGEMCGHGMGSCWVLPAQCAPHVDSQMWQECQGPDAVPGPCVDTCSAIASEKSYAPPHRGTTCN